SKTRAISFAQAIDASKERTIPEHQVEHLVERSSEESVLPAVRRLNENSRKASGVFLPLARHGQSAERAGATPLVRRMRGPGGDPGRGRSCPRTRSNSWRWRAMIARTEECSTGGWR